MRKTSRTSSDHGLPDRAARRTEPMKKPELLQFRFLHMHVIHFALQLVQNARITVRSAPPTRPSSFTSAPLCAVPQ